MIKELIYKDDAIACLCNKKCDTEGRWCDDGDCAPVARIKSLPPVQSERQWIPCSERLPEEGTDVIVTRKFLGVKDESHGWNNHIPPSTYIEVAKRIDDFWCADSDEYKIARSRHTDPIAWMPLPEPYKEGEG